MIEIYIFSVQKGFYVNTKKWLAEGETSHDIYRAVQEICTSPSAEVEILALDMCKCSCCRTLDSSEQDEGNTILAPNFGSDKAGCSLAAINSYRYNFNPDYLQVTAFTNSFPVAENLYSCIECQTRPSCQWVAEMVWRLGKRS